jgi:hypothetical protein
MGGTVVNPQVRIVGVAVVALAVAVTLFALFQGREDGTQSLSHDPPSSEEGLATDEALAAVAEGRVFFGHQSVGMNILDGVTSAYASRGLEPPGVLESPSAPGVESAFAHAFIGQNGDPSMKVADFAAMLRAGQGAWADFAFMKFCYVDVVDGTDVDSLFSEYRATAAELQGEFPDVTFLHLTVPLTTEPGLTTKLKNLVGKGSQDRSDNVARERFNSLMRAEYGSSGRLVDVAALESTTPDGQRVSGTYDGKDYFALYEGYASDNGHLNATGGQVVAEGLLSVLADNIGG